MTPKTHIIRRIDGTEFMRNMTCYAPESIICTGHTFFRLSEKQKGVITCDCLREYLREKVPVIAGEQQNGNHAAFYKHKKNRFIRIIVDIKPDRVNIVTFYCVEKLPVIK